MRYISLFGKALDPDLRFVIGRTIVVAVTSLKSVSVETDSKSVTQIELNSRFKQRK